MWHSDQLVSLSRISRVGSTPATPCAARKASKSRTSASRDGDLLSQRTNESAVAKVSSDTEANALAIVEASSGSDKASASAARNRFIMVRGSQPLVGRRPAADRGGCFIQILEKDRKSVV